MAFVVEDGTGMATATSLVSVAEADAYHADSGNTAWTGLDAVKQPALIRATRYIEGVYGAMWPGLRLVESQALGWPRDPDQGAVDVDGMPLEGVPKSVKDAVCEAAVLELVTPNCLIPSIESGGGVIRERVDIIEIEYAPNSSPFTIYPAIANALRRIIFNRGVAKVVRS